MTVIKNAFTCGTRIRDGAYGQLDAFGDVHLGMSDFVLGTMPHLRSKTNSSKSWVYHPAPSPTSMLPVRIRALPSGAMAAETIIA